MNIHLLQFLDSLVHPPEDLGPLIAANRQVIGNKGYGTPELEMKYMHGVFRYIQSQHEELETFSWVQANNYNDNYYHIEIVPFIVNDKLDVNTHISFLFKYFEGEEMSSQISFDPLVYPDPEELHYARENNIKIEGSGIALSHLAAYWAFRKQKYQALEAPCLKMLSFLKLLEINFSMYYFLYVFGNGVEVKFNKEGVIVTRVDHNEYEVSPLGSGMDFQDPY
jgi:hypothetical protein